MRLDDSTVVEIKSPNNEQNPSELLALSAQTEHLLNAFYRNEEEAISAITTLHRGLATEDARAIVANMGAAWEYWSIHGNLIGFKQWYYQKSPWMALVHDKL